MGMDLLLYWCPAPRDMEGKVIFEGIDDAVWQRIKALKNEHLDDICECVHGCSLDEFFTGWLGQDVKEDELHDKFRRMMMDDYETLMISSRETYIGIVDQGRPLIVTGGMSGGDAPTDACYIVHMFAESLIFEAPFPDQVEEEAVEKVPLVHTLTAGEMTQQEWHWYRLKNGDLIYGCYPDDQLYFETEEGRTV